MDDNTFIAVIIIAYLIYLGFKTWVNRDKPSCDCPEDDE